MENNYLKSLSKKNRVLIIKELETMNYNNQHVIKTSNDTFTKFLEKYILNKNLNINKIFLLNSLVNDISLYFNQSVIIQYNKVSLDNIIIPYIFKNYNTTKFYSNDLKLSNYMNPNYDFYLLNMNLDDEIINDKNIIYYISDLDTITSENINFLRIHNKPFIIELKSKLHNIDNFRIISLPEHDIKSHNLSFIQIKRLWCILKYNNIFQ